MRLLHAPLLVPLLVSFSACAPPQKGAVGPVASGSAASSGSSVSSDSPSSTSSAAANDAAPRSTSTSPWDQEPNRVPPFPSDYTLNRTVPTRGEPPVQLSKVNQKANQITDDDAWFASNALSLPEWIVPNRFRKIVGNVPSTIPTDYNGQMLVRAIRGTEYAIALYGRTFAETTYVAVLDSNHHPVAIFDFTEVLRPLHTALSGVAIPAEVTWAALQDGILYVQTAHRTYAKTSNGKNAFITALDLATGEVFWQSAPLVANAQNFCIHGDSILSGYGFTAEPDFIYVLSRATGATLSKTPVKSGPSYLIEKDGKLFVRTYDTDYIFGINRATDTNAIDTK